MFGAGCWYKSTAMQRGLIRRKGKSWVLSYATRVHQPDGTVAWASAPKKMAVGDYLTQPLPTMRKLKDVFLFSNDTQIPSADRDRLEKVYLGDNWRAIAKGEHGTWEAVAGMPSEAGAIGSVLELCARSGDTCRLFAIGNFLVEDQ